MWRMDLFKEFRHGLLAVGLHVLFHTGQDKDWFDSQGWHNFFNIHQVVEFSTQFGIHTVNFNVNNIFLFSIILLLCYKIYKYTCI